MKSDDVNSDTDVDFNQKNNELDPKFEDVDHARISKYKKDKSNRDYSLKSNQKKRK